MNICKRPRRGHPRVYLPAIALRGTRRSSAPPRLSFAPIWAAPATASIRSGFIWNRSQATAHNVYLMLYPKSRLQEALTNHPELAARVFEALQRITPASFSPKAAFMAEACTRWSRRNWRRFLPAAFLRASRGMSASNTRRVCSLSEAESAYRWTR